MSVTDWSIYRRQVAVSVAVGVARLSPDAVRGCAAGAVDAFGAAAAHR